MESEAVIFATEKDVNIPFSSTDGKRLKSLTIRTMHEYYTWIAGISFSKCVRKGKLK